MKRPFLKAWDVTRKLPRVDAHVHSSLTDGCDTVEEYIQRAKALGLSVIAYTEHADDSSLWFDEYVRSRDRLQEMADPVKVYLAAEVKLARPDGTLALSSDRIRMLDFVVGVIHRYPNDDGGFYSFSDLDAEEAMDLDYRLSMALIENPLVDVLGHPGGVYATYYGRYNRDMLREIVTRAAERGVVVEINSKPGYASASAIVLERCLELDCMVSLGSDAHEASELGHVIEHMRQMVLGAAA